MKKIGTKKLIYSIIAIILAIVAFLHLNVDQSWSVAHGENTLSLGSYIFAEWNAYYEASSKLSTNVTSSNSSLSKNILKQKIEDKKAGDWIQDRALDHCKTMLYIEHLFKESNLSIDEQIVESQKKQFEAMLKSKEDEFKKYGVSKESFFRNQIYFEMKKGLIFKSVYGKNGKTAVSDEDLANYYKENYVKYAFINKPLVIEGSEEDSPNRKAEALSDEEIEKIEKQFKEYAELINSGQKSIKDVAEIFKQAENKTEDLLTETSARKDALSLPKDAEKALTDLETGKVAAVKTKDEYYLIFKDDISEESKKKSEDEKEREMILAYMKSEEFEEFIKEEVAKTNFKINKAAINKFKPAIFVPKKR